MCLSHIISLAASGCSIMVVYAVWDRVARVRFPAPRQTQNTLALAEVFCFEGKFPPQS